MIMVRFLQEEKIHSVSVMVIVADVRCVPNYLREHKIKPTASIVLTDGYLSGGWGKWDHPVLWLIVDNPNARPPVGKYIHVDSEDFK